MAAEEAPIPGLVDVFFLPFMAQGHLLPMVDMATMFSTRGVRATVLADHGTAPSVQPAVDRAARSGHPLRLLQLPGPPGGACSDPMSLPPEERTGAFAVTIGAMREPFRRLLRERRPACVVFDALFPWAVGYAREADVPTVLAFNGTCFFAMCASAAIGRLLHPHEGHATDSVVLPGLPRHVEMLRTQLPDLSVPEVAAVTDNMVESQTTSDGVVMNSFYEMEPDFVEHCRNDLGIRAWHVGPVSFDGEREAGDGSDCLRWLDGKDPGSVVYVCFGSWLRVSEAQMGEIAAVLESAGRPFIWVVGSSDGAGALTYRMATSKGLLITGWAPQAAILRHGAVGTFVTHCGWNSCLEAIAAGVPMVTWPLAAEQFYNEKLVVEILGAGVAVGSRVWAMGEEGRGVVTAEEIRRAVEGVMGKGEAAARVRRRAAELAGMARRATQDGGSSHADVGRLIDEVRVRAGLGARRDG